MSDTQMPRRDFLRAAAGAALALPAVAHASPALVRPATAPRAADRLKLGVASYSLRKFPRERAIEMVRALRTPYLNVKSFHLPYELSPAELTAGRRQFEAAGLTVTGGGTITFQEDTDAAVRRYFEYARHAGMPLLVVSGPPRVWPRVERFARQYDIRVAIHNHGPEDKHYPTPYDALKHIRDMDPRMGLCIDLGHTARTGIDVVKSVVDAGPRLLDLHIKGLRTFEPKETQVIVGEGILPVAEIFRTLLRMNYRGMVNLEYEIHADDPLPGMKQSFAYMRGVLAGLGT